MIRRHSTRLSQAHDEEPEEDDQGHRTAAHDYPEMGTVLSDRPDPGQQITVIGTRRQADAYGTPEDARNGDFGGEPGDTGMYWAEPGQQEWAREHLGPQEPAPPPPWDVSPVMARLAQAEEACQLIGTHPLERAILLRHATTVNGTQVDEHGDAPGHGTIPRASAPDSYDDRSTEGQGDPKWNQALPWGSKENENGAQVGMYPEGISAGGGPGISVGPVTAGMSREEFEDLRRHMDEAHGHPWPYSGAADFDRKPLAEEHAYEHMNSDPGHEHPPEFEYDPYWDQGDTAGHSHQFTGSHRTARVPWTGKERGSLHRWQEAPTVTWGDFVPSTEFLGRDVPPQSEADQREQEADPERLRQAEAAGDHQWEAHLRGEHGWGDRQVQDTRARGDRLGDMHEALHSGGLANHQHQDAPGQDRQEATEHSLSNMFGPDMSSNPGKDTPEGYGFAHPARGGYAGGDPMIGIIRSKEVNPPAHPDYWEQADPARFRRMMSALNVHVRVDGKEVHDHDDDGPDAPPQPHEHDDAADSLDGDEDKGPDSPVGKNGPEITSGQASGGFPVDKKPDAPLVNPDDPGDPVNDPGNWPAAGAEVSERGRAYTQGSGDGKVTRGAPGAAPGQGDEGDDPGKPVPFSPDDGDSGGGGDQPDDGSDGDEDTPFSKDAALLMFTAAASSPSFRFQFTASWSDVMAKARRIRAEGHVRIVHASAGMVIGEVRGDHDTYESGIQRPVGKRQAISHWACGCPWASFHQKTAASRYAGRPCSHVMALQFEAQSRGMFGRSFGSDAGVPSWSPESVVVKSWPPYEGEPHAGRWREEWRAPLARQTGMARAAGTPGTACLYRHDGPCPVARHWRTAGAVNRPRPEGFWSEVRENPEFDPHWSGHWASRSTHVLTGHLGPEEAGQLHFSKSDDGRAHQVNMLHADAQGQGVASAMMDDLYGHVRQAGGWLNHGTRTAAGDKWWASYQEPHPEVSTHRAPPQAGWGQYFPAYYTAAEAASNERHSGGAGYHPGPDWHDRAGNYTDHGTQHQWRHALGTEDDVPAQRATAVLLRAGDDPGTVGALRLLAGMRATADQANGPWGSDNTAQHPPQKPYGATSPPNKDQDPGSYGPLAAPDPENWGGIQDGSAYQMPLSNTASGHQVLAPGAPRPVPGDLHWPGIEGWQAEDQGTFGYTDHASTAGPSTAMSPRDPNGIRMEEARVTAAGTPFPVNDTVPQLDGALAELRDHPEPALPDTTGDDEIEATAAADGTIGGGDAGTGEGQGAALDTAALGEFGASVRAALWHVTGGTPMGDLGRETSPQAQQPSTAGQEPGMGSMDDALSPDDSSIQTIGGQQWSGGGSDSDEGAVEPGQPQGSIDDIVASFQRSAASNGYAGGSAPGQADGDIAVAARQYLAKTADALPKAEADELIREGRGQRARNLDLLRLEGTHYEDEDDELARKGISMDDHDDDVIFA